MPTVFFYVVSKPSPWYGYNQSVRRAHGDRHIWPDLSKSSRHLSRPPVSLVIREMITPLFL